MFDEHLDRFCSLSDIHIDLKARIQLATLLDDHHEEFEQALWWSLSRLFFARFGPRSVYPGRLCRRLITAPLARPSSAALARLFEQVGAADHVGWTTLVDIMTQLAGQTHRWTIWPEPIVCERAAVQLDALERPWNLAVERLRADSRAHERDDAFRRAMAWRDLTVKILRILTTPRGKLRLVLEYLLCVRMEFHRSQGAGLAVL